jgi:hypothetical protein
MIKMQKAESQGLFLSLVAMRYTHFTWRVRSGDGISITKSDLGKAKSGLSAATLLKVYVCEERERTLSNTAASFANTPLMVLTQNINESHEH